LVDGLEIASWRLNAELVVLSACCAGQRAITQRGAATDTLEELPGDDVFGLQAAFFMAGAKRLVSNLWPAEGGPADKITTAIHRYALEGNPIEVALQKALKDCLNRVLDRQLYRWALFFLVAVGRSTQKPLKPAPVSSTIHDTLPMNLELIVP